MGQIRLTPEGVELLERQLAKEFARNPKEIRRAAEAIGLDLDGLLQGYIIESINREEEQMYGKRYSFP